jgi:hypothetical protein
MTDVALLLPSHTRWGLKARSTWCLALVGVCLGCAGGSPGSGAGGGSGKAGAGSSGSAGPGTGAGPAASGAVVSPDAMAPTAPSGGSPVVSQPLWRLSNAEYANTAHDLLGTPVSSVPPLDPDAPSGGFRVGGVAGDATSRAYHDAAVLIASQAVANLPQLMQAFGCAATVDATCFVPAIAQTAFRRQLDMATHTAIQTGLTNLYNTIASAPGGSSTLGIQAVIEDVLQSPYFLYHLELEEQAKGPGPVAVANYSMANRLSYLLWASMPDTAAMSKAAAGQLATSDQVKVEAARMLADPKAHIGLANFYDQWLTVLNLPSVKTGNAAAVYTPAVQAALRASFDAQVDDALWAPTGALKALLGSTQVYVNATLAPIFGVVAAGNALTKVAVDPAQRTGIVTHPALMAIYATNAESHPIKRGRFVWEQLLCQPFPDPPATTPIGPPAFAPPMPGESLRQDFERLTRGTVEPNPPDMGHQSYCMPCHSRVNPVGFLFENYDTTGKYRTIDDYGQPVKTSDLAVVGAVDAALNGPTMSPTQFANNLASHDASIAQCLVTQVYRYMAKRGDDTPDAPAISALQNAFAQSQENLTQVLVGLTQTDVFLYRMNVP